MGSTLCMQVFQSLSLQNAVASEKILGSTSVRARIASLQLDGRSDSTTKLGREACPWAATAVVRTGTPCTCFRELQFRSITVGNGRMTKSHSHKHYPVRRALNLQALPTILNRERPHCNRRTRASNGYLRNVQQMCQKICSKYFMASGFIWAPRLSDEEKRLFS